MQEEREGESAAGHFGHQQYYKSGGSSSSSSSGSEEKIYVAPPSISGFFFHTSDGKPTYAPFCPETNSLPDPSLSFFPEDVSVKASHRGHLCCLGRRTRQLYVCNPVTCLWVLLPPARRNHDPDSTSVVLILDESNIPMFLYEKSPKFECSVHFWVVCAYPGPDEGSYGFESFTSEMWHWEDPGELIWPGRLESGVAAGAKAWWRTSREELAMFYPRYLSTGKIVRREKKDQLDNIMCWEIGEVRGALCTTDVLEPPSLLAAVASPVVVRRQEKYRWPLGPLLADCESLGGSIDKKMTPLRMQGAPEMMLWDGDRQIFGYEFDGQLKRHLVIDTPDFCTDFLPFIIEKMLTLHCA
ncbi:F-box/kelch-repeat protein [Canna indica]|uniref:F-box/kelch-repeat protein n=1 Tax=Canna indica TaxID=4628 RepID=A0AAQ3Q8H1_9LILI|nr:F-box/kelch-repeat protein [Canna indica]